jgi:maltose O-acetyltransferase
MSIPKKGSIFELLLQIKFLIVAFINFTYSVIPFFFLKKLFLRLFKIKLGAKTYIHRGVKFFHIGNLTIGHNSVINFGCYLDNRREIHIGNNVGIAHNTKIYTLGHDLNDPEFGTKGSQVTINDNVFIFSNCIVMPGVTVGEGAVILPGSIVTKDISPYTIVGGNPAKYIKDRTVAINYSINYGYWFAL